VVGAGTWNTDGETVERSVRAVPDDGYRHIDTDEVWKSILSL